MENQLSEAEAASIRQQIKCCAVMAERNLTDALEAELAGFTYAAQVRRDLATLSSLFALDLAERNREVLGA
ncbi:hypothetical protein [Solimonas marina]|uniref:Uncharacterized protein n=1 Tax=Solimonas marina TaxID=2714601 RepID=A0A969WDK1_9GAMM|nr:hypothetical protein [Solimonas marina]NKF24584.1 hypothetical protein [Solimonas marina]